ncbi:A/G-specific adenine glycosylase [Anaerotignum lactatifermentans]|uniref:Adenine DNA glycosylase n=2 Tax=Anaerotignum lactatifermentans TaxID=160404 RepID=A0ABS2GAS9_9FIRM|nr:A/G-specific adenine glycosylase [Anaerotignum lactatifermentans]MBM6877982.1 A/G-specific adenine glycosylase [Anaerotignum lactatifermentans]MBM6950157.1 A/G-specific adenine glycosylase [Anaerotignum lactatifermentans]
MKQLLPLLIEWYRENKRDLPWRRTKDPYRIWLSEIMLQQTRVEAVKPYYERFLAALPAIKDLAEAEEELILKLWEGLGYYSRVRNMQTAAQQIMKEYGGALPADYEKLRSLKGIGTYTAGAIASIAFGLPHAAVDGNVLRVLSRIFLDAQDIGLEATKKYWKEELENVLTGEIASDVNEGWMEVGATICLPNGEPKCGICPFREYCGAYRQSVIHLYPVKGEKKARTVERLQVVFLTDGKRVALRKRGPGLLANLWELPNGGAEISLPSLLHLWGILDGEITPMRHRKHIFTHVQWDMDCYFVQTKSTEDTPFLWLEPDRITEEYALPSAFRAVWAEGRKKLQ